MAGSFFFGGGVVNSYSSILNKDISVRCDITSQNWDYLPEARPLCGKTKLLIHRQEMLEKPESDVRKI